MNHIDMRGPKGYGFLAVLVRIRVSILVYFSYFTSLLHSSLDMGILSKKKPFFRQYRLK